MNYETIETILMWIFCILIAGLILYGITEGICMIVKWRKKRK